jgi:hypothetical protein
MMQLRLARRYEIEYSVKEGILARCIGVSRLECGCISGYNKSARKPYFQINRRLYKVFILICGIKGIRPAKLLRGFRACKAWV